MNNVDKKEISRVHIQINSFWLKKLDYYADYFSLTRSSLINMIIVDALNNLDDKYGNKGFD